MTKFKVGDRVVTNSGHTATVASISDDYIRVKYDGGVPKHILGRNFWNHDGTKYRPKYDVDGLRTISLIDNTSIIDTSKPLEAVCKSTGRVVPMEYKCRGTLFGKPVLYTKKAPCPGTSNGTWHADGSDYFHHDAWYIRNVESIDWNGQLRTREGSSIVTLEGTLEDGRRVVSFRRFGSKITQIVNADGRIDDREGRTSGDDVVNPHEPLVREYRNIYANGQIGLTVHKEWADVIARSTYNHTRVGVLINETRGGKIVSSRVQAAEPQLRTRDNPAGINPFK